MIYTDLRGADNWPHLDVPEYPQDSSGPIPPCQLCFFLLSSTQLHITAGLLLNQNLCLASKLPMHKITYCQANILITVYAFHLLSL